MSRSGLWDCRVAAESESIARHRVRAAATGRCRYSRFVVVACALALIATSCVSGDGEADDDAEASPGTVVTSAPLGTPDSTATVSTATSTSEVAGTADSDDDGDDADGLQFLDISAGTWHICGIVADGTLTCRGTDTHGQIAAPDGVFTAISAGAFHACGVRMDSTVSCWGAEGLTDSYPIDPPEGSFLTVSAGAHYTCGLRMDQTIECWGQNTEGALDVPVGTFVDVTAAPRGPCALSTDGVRRALHRFAATHLSRCRHPRRRTLADVHVRACQRGPDSVHARRETLREPSLGQSHPGHRRRFP